MGHAGRAVVFSGLTVAIGLVSMIVLPVPMLRSVGYGGVLVGRLEWHAQTQRLGDNRPTILATERERDRVLGVIRDIVAR